MHNDASFNHCRTLQLVHFRARIQCLFFRQFVQTVTPNRVACAERLIALPRAPSVQPQSAPPICSCVVPRNAALQLVIFKRVQASLTYLHVNFVLLIPCGKDKPRWKCEGGSVNARISIFKVLCKSLYHFGEISLHLLLCSCDRRCLLHYLLEVQSLTAVFSCCFIKLCSLRFSWNDTKYCKTKLQNKPSVLERWKIYICIKKKLNVIKRKRKGFSK